MRRLLDASVPISAIAVNVSFRDLESMPLAQHVRDILADNGLRGDQLKLELTESDIMRNVDQTLATLEQIRALGVRIAVDDFGTGFSSLAYLRMLPLDTLKIDASFVAAMENEANAKSIVETIVSLGKVLNLKLVAEGVETFVETELLRQLNVDYLQGWYFSRSVKENALAQTLARLQSPGPTASTDPSQC